jgi:hypothetical protein
MSGLVTPGTVWILPVQMIVYTRIHEQHYLILLLSKAGVTINLCKSIRYNATLSFRAGALGAVEGWKSCFASGLGEEMLLVIAGVSVAVMKTYVLRQVPRPRVIRRLTA